MYISKNIPWRFRCVVWSGWRWADVQWEMDHFSAWHNLIPSLSQLQLSLSLLSVPAQRYPPQATADSPKFLPYQFLDPAHASRAHLQSRLSNPGLRSPRAALHSSCALCEFSAQTFLGKGENQLSYSCLKGYTFPIIRVGNFSDDVNIMSTLIQLKQVIYCLALPHREWGQE